MKGISRTSLSGHEGRPWPMPMILAETKNTPKARALGVFWHVAISGVTFAWPRFSGRLMT